MSKILVLAEKPSVGREIAKVLKARNNKGSYIEGDKYIITWALGHLVELQSPEGYDIKYKKWSMDTLPMLPKHMKLTVIKKAYKQFNEVKKQMNRNDVNEIIIATDAGREGELVARWIIEKAGVKKNLKRLWISSQTDRAILAGFKNLKPAKQYDNLYCAAKCRAEADWIVGLNVTRALTCKYNAQLSAGRVQSPTLAMIVNREEEIKSFKPKEFYTINIKGNGVVFNWVNKENNGKIFDEEFANKLLLKLKGMQCEIVDIKEKDKKQFSPALYDLTELQRDCNKIWGYSAKQTLSIMQRLYENHKILTYPRTDSRYISKDIVNTISERLSAISIGEYRMIAQQLLKEKINAHKGFVDDSKVSDHHAIIPTEEKPNISNLSVEEKHVYDLVVKRFLSVMLPPFEYIQTNIEANINGEKFIAKGKVIKTKGWKKVYDKFNIEEDNVDDIKEQQLPKFVLGQKFKVSTINLNKDKTKPPTRFNEGTLLSAMENPHKYIVVGKDAAKTLGETGGLGTVATRADIIEKLYNSFVIEKRGKEIVPTSKGHQLIDLVPKELKSPLLTAKWEKQLDEISKGKANANNFIKDMRNYAIALVEDVKDTNSKFIHDNKTGKKCPNCGKYLLEVKGKNGVMNVCQDRECGYRESVSRITNARCPECKKKLELRGHGGGEIYICPNTNCNFREKASVFNKRFNNKSDKFNKKEINNIMKKMKKDAEEDINNPFAELLKGFK
ncbi:DNA topoisomerase III [Clostridium tarantellae]|uniref:DNA topoisomerase 3 n=1 Tax=Clostridium tarantellae TaxID=39493 RepID=A0A6I1MTI1_9CLOT|nr:DNA topoisomerase III [Clostridium tarantellae]MPQ44181.1 DNA topoisomerase III [Clostridium tarantellae]